MTPSELREQYRDGFMEIGAAFAGTHPGDAFRVIQEMQAQLEILAWTVAMLIEIVEKGGSDAE